MKLDVKVVPKASRDRIAGWVGARLKVTVTAAPERGKANAAVVGIVSEVLGVPRARVRVTAGETSPLKTLEIDGLDEAIVRRRLSS